MSTPPMARHLLDYANTASGRPVHTLCGQRYPGVLLARDADDATCPSCRRVAHRIALREQATLAATKPIGDVEPFTQLERFLTLEVLWACWGCFYYEERAQMWEARYARPLFPVIVALGVDAWMTLGFEPPRAIVDDVNAIREDFRRHTGRELTLEVSRP